MNYINKMWMFLHNTAKSTVMLADIQLTLSVFKLIDWNDFNMAPLLNNVQKWVLDTSGKLHGKCTWGCLESCLRSRDCMSTSHSVLAVCLGSGEGNMSSSLLNAPQCPPAIFFKCVFLLSGVEQECAVGFFLFFSDENSCLLQWQWTKQ